MQNETEIKKDIADIPLEGIAALLYDSINLQQMLVDQLRLRGSDDDMDVFHQFFSTVRLLVITNVPDSHLNTFQHESA